MQNLQPLMNEEASPPISDANEPASDAAIRFGQSPLGNPRVGAFASNQQSSSRFSQAHRNRSLLLVLVQADQLKRAFLLARSARIRLGSGCPAHRDSADAVRRHAVARNS